MADRFDHNPGDTLAAAGWDLCRGDGTWRDPDGAGSRRRTLGVQPGMVFPAHRPDERRRDGQSGPDRHNACPAAADRDLAGEPDARRGCLARGAGRSSRQRRPRPRPPVRCVRTAGWLPTASGGPGSISRRVPLPATATTSPPPRRGRVPPPMVWSGRVPTCRCRRRTPISLPARPPAAPARPRRPARMAGSSRPRPPATRWSPSSKAHPRQF